MTTETTPAEPKPAGIWQTFVEAPLAVKAVLGGVFVNKVGGFLNIFLVLFLTARGYTEAQAASALGAYGVGSVIGVLIGGALADRLGARNATVLSMAGSAMLIGSLLYLPNYGSLIVAIVVVAAVSQVYRPASATLLSELTSDDRQVMTFAMYRFGLNLGTTAAPLIGFGLFHLGGESYHLLFWGEALVALAYALLAAVALPTKARERELSGRGGAEEDGAAPAGSYLELFKDGRYLCYLLGMFFNSILYVQYMSTLPLDVQASGVPVFWYTLAVSLNGGAVILLELLVTKKTQRLKPRLVVLTSYSLVAVGYALYGLPLGPAVIVIGTLVWTLGEIIGGPVVFAYPGMAGPAHLKSRYIGSFQFVFGLGSAIGPVLGGMLFLGIGRGVWPVLAGFGLLAALVGAYGVTARKAADDAPAAVADPVEPVLVAEEKKG
ncbi:MFS transporter [Actinosynnema pretiosum]|uniref:Major facilitator transporter n=2 Tax=Actinosynnema pretiosum TaxID=42197 RepID=A0A4Y6A7N3_9PSEU|nr:MFS transporter [Actinosynnema pretiosum]ATE54185.1 MFS transporter [Actinosynnema pretiosum]QDE53660.1 major facilitator transporter [Actinosynnema pretiosum subsp. pretiosum]